MSDTILAMGNQGDRNPYHLLFCILSQLRPLDTGENIVKFCYDNQVYSYLREAAFKALPPRFQRYFDLPEGLTVKYGITTHLSFVHPSDGWVHRYARDLYKHLCTGSDTPKKIYISRRKAQGRRVLNEEDLIEDFRSHGISTYVLEDMTFEDCIRLFHESHLVIGPHGAGLSFAAFCKPGTVLLEINKPDQNQIHFSFLAAECRLKYMRFIDLTCVPNPSHPNENYDVNKNELMTMIDEITEYLQVQGEPVAPQSNASA
jgi:hypothetical protein